MSLMKKVQNPKKLNQKGFAHIGLLLLAILVIGVVGFAASRVLTSNSDDNNKNQSANLQPVRSDNQQDVPECTPADKSKTAFTDLPFDVSQIKVVTLGKETNDPRFLYPWVKTDTTDRTNIYAPADGTLFVIRHKVFEINGENGNDYDIFFEVDCQTVYRFNHITHPRDDIKAAYPAGDLPSGDYANGGLDIPERVKPKTAVKVSAGESIGYTTGTPGAHNFDFAVGVAENKDSEKLTVCPFNVFDEPNKSKLLALLGPKSTYTPQSGYPCDVESKQF